MTEPRSGYELTVFVIPAHLGQLVAPALDEVVARTRSVNAAFAWLVVDSRVCALQSPAAEVTGVVLARRCAEGVYTSADLTEGLVMAFGIAQQFIQAHDDGLPAAVDILTVADARCRLDASALTLGSAEEVVQAGVVLHDYPDPGGLPRDMHRLHTDAVAHLGLLWSLLQSRHRIVRRPAALLG
ncbi:MAG TPA: hypothetical protein VFB74_05805 [Kribbellaceae bacterium]|nr:hypothetical protein [Kribbellaceae bacterium]